jgi:hypothetical protein
MSPRAKKVAQSKDVWTTLAMLLLIHNVPQVKTFIETNVEASVAVYGCLNVVISGAKKKVGDWLEFRALMKSCDVSGR